MKKDICNMNSCWDDDVKPSVLSDSWNYICMTYYSFVVLHLDT